MQCPIARSLERIGEWWNILILRDAFYGLTRFDQFQRSLDIAPNILTRRLNGLVDAGLLERHRYCERPPRDEYLLTARGKDLWPIIIMLLDWGNKHYAPEGVSVELIDTENEQLAQPVLIDQQSGKPIDQEHFKLKPGIAANEKMRRRLAFVDEQRINAKIKKPISSKED